MYPVAEDHLRRPEDPGQLQRGEPLLRQRRLLSRTIRRRASSSAIPIFRGWKRASRRPRPGFGPEPNLTVENSYLRNYANVDGPDQRVGQRLLDGATSWWLSATRGSRRRRAGASTRSRWSATSPCAPECLSKLDEVRVYAYNGVATDNFQVYHTNTSVLPRPPAAARRPRAPVSSGLLCPIAALGPVAAHRDAERVAGVDHARPVGDPDAGTRPTPRRCQINQGIGTVAASGTRSVSPDRDDHLHPDRDQRRRVGDRDRHRHRRRGTRHDADDHLEQSRQHRLRDGVERDAAERDHDGAGIVGVFAGCRHGARGGDRSDAVGHVYARPTRPPTTRATATGRDHRPEGDAAHHLGEPGRHHLRDAAQRHAVERDGERGRELRLHAAERDGARRRRRAAALRPPSRRPPPPTTTRRARPC